ncbi:hemolysin family protein [Chloroflexota bacterium]
MNVTLAYILLLMLSVLFSAFFCSSETAFFSLRRVKLEQLVASRARGADRVAKLLGQPERLLSIVLLGTNLANTAAAALGTVLAVNAWGESVGMAVATVGVTSLLLIAAETTPKTIATRHAEKMALLFARPLEIIGYMFAPVVWLLSLIASGLSGISGKRTVSRSLVSAEEIRTMISVGHREGTMEEGEADMLNRVFDFGDSPVREVMIPRIDVVALERGSRLADFLKIYSEQPLSRFPVYTENMDNVDGILSVKDVLMAFANGSVANDSLVDDLVRPAYFAPETKPIDELFFEMRDGNFRMCVVVDEFGGTAGVVSLSRLVEEIVGEVGDELADVEKDYEIINEYTYQVDGSMRVEDANEEMALDLPDGGYETVAGFLLHLLGHIPERNEQVRYKGLKIVITEMKSLKIETILITKIQQQAADWRKKNGQAEAEKLG